MALLDVIGPQLFADRGGLLGRLISMRPDLAQDRQEYPGCLEGVSRELPWQQSRI